MKSYVPLILTLLMGAGCASNTRPTTPAASGTSASAPDAKPTPAPNAGFPLTEQERAEQERTAKKVEDLRAKLVSAADEQHSGAAVIVVDPKTGEKQERIEKTNRNYFESNKHLYSVLMPKLTLQVLREDDQAWYVPAARPRRAKTKREDELKSEAMARAPIVMPAEEAEVVVPKRTKEKIVLEEISEGLPTTGMWRDNFAMADLDGDGRPEIVSPPARLSGANIQVFKWDGKGWVKPPLTFEDPENIGMEYGGIACADMDGDGRPDIVFGKHGGGPAIAYNKGDWHFVIASRGIPKEMSVRALAIGDLDGDGHPDILALSDMPEWGEVRRQESIGITTARLPRADGYAFGIDARAFFRKPDGRYEEVHDGLEKACFGYTLALQAAPSDGLAPFFAGGCRYSGYPLVVFTYDKAKKSFAPFPTEDGEYNALHVGTAAGTYQGHPAAVVSYSKATPMTATPNISGYGLTIYYRDGGKWTRKRILKVVQDAYLSQGLAMGDLNGDGLDDVVFADEVEGRLRILLQRADGSFEEIAKELEPTFINHATAIRLADVDGDGRPDIIMSYQPYSTDPTRSGGFRVFRNRK